MQHQVNCEVCILTTGLEVISNLWKCFRKFGDQDGSKLFKEVSKESKITEILFKYFIAKLPRPSKQ